MPFARLLAFILLLVSAQTASAAPIAAGARVPAGFAAVDAAGKARSFKSIAGRNGTVLVFFRSAKWCPYCQAQLKDLNALQPELAKRGMSLAAISYDPPATLAAFAQNNALRYTLLSDGGSRMVDLFGLRDPQYPEGHFAYGVPKASILVIDPRGKVRSVMIADDYKVRPGNAAILSAAGALARR